MRNCDSPLKEAVRVALEKRYAFDTTSAHGLIHLALQAARLGDAEKVNTNIDHFARRHYLYNGLVTSHDPELSIYNLDGILSFPRLLMEMLIYTEPNRIEILPAWPDNFPDGSITGMRVYGGHTIDMTWKDKKMVSVNIHAANDEKCELVFDGKTKCILLERGKNYTLDEYGVLQGD